MKPNPHNIFQKVSSMYDTSYKIWVVAESAGGDETENSQILSDIVDVFQNGGYYVGIISELGTWYDYYGDFTKLKDLDLIYKPIDDMTLSYRDFVPFGGWNKPTMKMLT